MTSMINSTNKSHKSNSIWSNSEPAYLKGMEEWKVRLASGIGKSEWKQLLSYTSDLHITCTHAPTPPFHQPWEEIGTGYCYGPACGHWDLVHAALDFLPHHPLHAKNQLLNLLALQRHDGMLPGSVWMRGDSVSWSNTESHPPVWPEAAQAYYSLTGDTPFLGVTLRALDKQLHWFEANRNAQDGGFYYTDILNHEWESGVDEGVRFDEIATGPYACIDATSHLYRAYEIAEHWAMELQETTLADLYRSKRLVLQIFIQDRMFNEDVSYFFDIWSVNEPDHQHLAFEGLWPVVTGAATSDQAHRVIDRYVLSQQHFLTEHPLPTLAISDPKFELRMWRGPAWNSMTYWVALGCYRYGRTDAAMLLLEKALDSTAKQFAKTGTIWEFYHPFGETPDKVARKPHTPYNVPCRDYLGHNPLIAMAQLWDLCK